LLGGSRKEKQQRYILYSDGTNFKESIVVYILHNPRDTVLYTGLCHWRETDGRVGSEAPTCRRHAADSHPNAHTNHPISFQVLLLLLCLLPS
jgi:hypothetical protein